MSQNACSEDQGDGAFASPACFMHEIDPAYGGMLSDAEQARDVARWRKVERERLIAARLALPVGERDAHAALIGRDLDTVVPCEAGTIVSLYWPFRGEPDLRPWMTKAREAGVRTALPVVVAKGHPLEFRVWSAACGTSLVRWTAHASRRLL